MKLVIFISLLLTVNYSFSQTKLINHKSHSGTVQNFNALKTNGNFGLVEFNKELEKNAFSTYKLVLSRGPYGMKYTLFITENKDMKKTMCLANDTIIQTVIIQDTPSKKLKNTIENVLIDELRKYRKLESED